MLPPIVMKAYGLEDAASITVLGGGLINETFAAWSNEGEAIGVFQKLHRIFEPELNLDLHQVTSHLACKGIATPRLIFTNNNQPWVTVGDDHWRGITYIPGTTHARCLSTDLAYSAGELVGRFHRALNDFQYEYAFTRAGIHDTKAHLARLEKVTKSSAQKSPPLPELEEARELSQLISDAAQQMPPMPTLPVRHCHGDLKISNVLFRSSTAHCLVDLDTLGFQTLAYELGDALRSWCNSAGEDKAQPQMDVKLFDCALRGYKSGAGEILSLEETNSIVTGLETVCIEVAARFCRDAFENQYFGWDETKYSSRREHNLIRATSQLQLGRWIADHRDDLKMCVSEIF